MPRPDGRIDAGDRAGTALTAKAWNAMVDAKEKFDADRLSTSAPGMSAGGASAFNRVMAKNTSGTAIPRWGACQMLGITPAAGASASQGANAQFIRSPTVTVAVPSSASSTAPVAIALQPIKPGALGWAAVAGVVQCVATISDASHTRLALGASSTSMASGTSGQLEILWKEGVGSGKLALARFSAAAGSSIKIGRTTADWAKGTSASIPIYGGTPLSESATGESVTAYNLRAKILADRWVVLGKADNGFYYLIDSEMDQVSAVWNVEYGTNKILFRRKKFWVVSVEADTDVELETAECVPPYNG